jgi:hypothetical protein
LEKNGVLVPIRRRVKGERVRRIDLTEAEQELLDKLPGPPATAVNHVNNIWIVEWLQAGEQLTGLSLHEWMEGQRPGWSAYFQCRTKLEVLSAIKRATNYAQQTGRIPVLHLEAHGSTIGLSDRREGSELLSWDELTEPLQALNKVTRCNLIIFVAACTGFAAIQVFLKGRAPAFALVGPDTTLTPDILFIGTKEFYRRLMRDENPRLSEMAASASRQAGSGVIIEPEPFAIMAFEAMVESLLVSIRPYKQRLRKDGQMRQEIVTAFQKEWDEKFMIDLYPENRKRFGVDLAAIVELLAC